MSTCCCPLSATWLQVLSWPELFINSPTIQPHRLQQRHPHRLSVFAAADDAELRIQFTVTSPLIPASRFFPIPFTFINAFTLRHGLPSMMRRAITGPMPDRDSSCDCEAVFTLTGPDGANCFPGRPDAEEPLPDLGCTDEDTAGHPLSDALPSRVSSSLSGREANRSSPVATSMASTQTAYPLRGRSPLAWGSRKPTIRRTAGSYNAFQ